MSKIDADTEAFNLTTNESGDDLDTSDYMDDDGEDVFEKEEEEGEESDATAQDDMIMANRTAQLMSDFRSYISEMQGPPENEVDPVAVKMAVEYGEIFGNVDPMEEAGSTLLSPSEDTESGMLRDWSNTFSSNEGASRYSDKKFDVNTGYGDIHDDVILSRNKYKGKYRYSTKLKRCIVATVVTTAIVSVVIGVTTSVIQANKEKNLPDWESQLTEVQAEEQQKKQNSQPSIQVSEPLQGPVETQPTVLVTKATTENKAKEILDFAIKNPETEAYKHVGVRYEPQWFERSSGWEGTDYSEAVAFCSSRKDLNGKFMEMCPYTAYCPEGKANVPYGGPKEEVGTWAPILGAMNEWVDVGSGKNTCRLYSDMNSDPPDWGKSGGNEAMTRHIMCCKAQERGSITTTSTTATTSTITTTSEMTTTSTTTSTSTTTTTTSMSTTAQPQTATQSDFSSDPELLDSDVADEYTFAESYRPVWYSRESNWTGQSYLAASFFCSERNSTLCPYEAYCPLGPHKLPYGGVRPESNLWSPISDSHNSWVSVGREHTCLNYMVLYLQSPYWGLSGEDNEEITRYLLCCQEQDRISSGS